MPDDNDGLPDKLANKIRAQARENFCNDDLEIDEDAELSHPEGGAGTWVAAWVWVCDEELGEEVPDGDGQ